MFIRIVNNKVLGVLIGFLIFVFITAIGTYIDNQIAKSQTAPLTTRQVWNTSSNTLKVYHAVQWDTAYHFLYALDTALVGVGKNSSGDSGVWYWKGDSTDTVGVYRRGLLKDTLENYGKAFYIQVRPVTTPSTDTVILCGDTIPHWDQSYTTTGKKKDTLVWATTLNNQFSDRVWSDFDSIKIIVSNGGSDSFRFFYKVANGIEIADSATNRFAGIVMSDSIATKTLGSIVIRGRFWARVNGILRYVKPGDPLYTGKNGKLQFPEFLRKDTTATIVYDTIRTSTSREKRYRRGVVGGNPVLVTKLRYYPYVIDTIGWAGYSVTDSIYVVAFNTSAGIAIPTAIADTLSVVTFVNPQARPDPNYLAAWALDYIRAQDSLRIPVDIGK